MSRPFIFLKLILGRYLSKKELMFLVLDNHNQIEGIVTLEDCVETVLGVEIMDKSLSKT